MQLHDREQFLKVINGLAAVLPGASITTDALDLWWLALKDWTIEEFRDAAAHLLGTCKFMPTPRDFLELRKAGRMTSGEAFQKALSVARSASAYGGNTSGDPLIDSVANACGGYFAMGLTETAKLGFLERRFAEHFEQISQAEQTRDAVPQIAAHGRPRVNGPQPIGQLLQRRA
jgi:hypothetical protein